MTQEEIMMLETKANAGDAVAQYDFGRLLIVNNYYDAGKDFISKAAEQQNEAAKKWIELHKKLTTALEKIDGYETMQGKLIKLWNVKKGESSATFSFTALQDGAVMVFVDKSENENSPFKHFHTELISEQYFHILFDLWPSYLDGKIPTKEIKPTRNAKYLISILHYLFETNPDLQV